MHTPFDKGKHRPTIFEVNDAPVADAGADQDSAAIGVTIVFDGAGSYDEENDPLSFTWDFGDGTTGSGETAAHSYAVTGIYTAVLTVSDGALSASDEMVVTITDDPYPSMTMHAAAIDMRFEYRGINTSAVATVTIVAADGTPVAGRSSPANGVTRPRMRAPARPTVTARTACCPTR